MRIILFLTLLAITVPQATQALEGFEVPDIPLANLSPGGDTGDIVGSLEEIVNFLASILANLAILVIVIAGILYITSGGDQEKIDRAKTWLTYAIVGLIIALLAWVIVQNVADVFNVG